VLTIPTNAFVDAQVWHATSKDKVDAINALMTNLFQATGQNAVTTSCIIPLPPFLIPFFIDNINSPLVQLCK